MKTLILLFILYCSYLHAQTDTPTRTFKIKSDSNTYLVYSSEGELLYEFTPRNTDSLNLKTLNLIYSKYDEVIAESVKDTINKVVTVRIENIPEKDSLLADSLKVFIPTVLALLFGFLLSYIPQKNQSVQSAFFQLMENQYKILENISVDYLKASKKKEFKGIGFFIHLKERMNELYELITKEYNIEQVPLDRDKLNTMAVGLQDSYSKAEELKEFYKNKPKKKRNQNEIEYENVLSLHVFNFVYSRYQDNIGNYFRHLFNTIRYLDDSKLIFGKKKLLNFIQAKMSDSELFVLFYDGLKYDDMKKYIERYKITRNLFRVDLLNENHEKFYRVKLLKNKNDN